MRRMMTVILLLTACVRCLTSSASFSVLKYPAETVNKRVYSKDGLHTFKLWFGPVEIGNITEVFAVQVQALSESHQFPQLLDQCCPAHVRSPRLCERLRQ